MAMILRLLSQFWKLKFTYCFVIYIWNDINSCLWNVSYICILNFGSCIMKIDNIHVWRKLWLTNIKRCFWQILKITVGMFCYMPEQTNSQMVMTHDGYCFVRLIWDESLKYRHIFQSSWSWYSWITSLKLKALKSGNVQGD